MYVKSGVLAVVGNDIFLLNDGKIDNRQNGVFYTHLSVASEGGKAERLK